MNIAAGIGMLTGMIIFGSHRALSLTRICVSTREIKKMSALAEGAPSTLLVAWRKLRHLLPVYTAIASSFNFSPPPCSDLSEVEIGDGEAVLQFARWIDGIDTVSQAQHLSTVLQDLDVCSSDMCVHTWLQHFISKPARTAADRDKIDFLLSHY